jgi:hypothetical protein
MRRIFTAEAMLKLGVGLVFIASLIVTPTIGQTRHNSADKLMAASQVSAKTVTVKGKVKMVSETSLTVVDDQKAEYTISLDAKTKITKSGKAATAADIKADDAVVVVATKGEGDALTATTITIA